MIFPSWNYNQCRIHNGNYDYYQGVYVIDYSFLTTDLGLLKLNIFVLQSLTFVCLPV